MHIDVIKSIIITVLFAALMVSGCKGKEEKQIVSPPSPEQQEKVIPPPSAFPEILSKETSPISPEIMADTTPKVTSLKVYPESPTIKDSKIKAEAATFDKEGDNVFLTYYWTKNGVPVPEISDTLSGSFKRGDKIGITVVPDDGVRKGNPISVVITIANASPVIQPSQETFKFDGSFYSYQIKATDPDGDTLTYSLKSSPPGMTIDPSGLIKWNVPSDFKGKAPITIMVSDGHGGEVIQSFTLEIIPEKK